MHNQKPAVKSQATNLKTIGKRSCFPLFVLLAFTDPANAVDLKLTAPDGDASDLFGGSVALSDNTALIGSREDDDNGESSGSAYLFDTTTGSFLQKFIAPDGSQGDNFGFSVALSDNTAIIGAWKDNDNGESSGSAYLFDTTTGSFLQKFIAPDGWPYDQFGYSVALSDNTALIGSREDDDNGESSGSAYLFDTTTGSFLQKFIAPDGWPYDQFGYSVALSDNTALIGSREDDDNGESSGSAYLFDTTTGSFLQKFIAPDGWPYDQFGYSVALSDNTALIGSREDDDNGESSGSAYLFDTTTGSFLQKFIAPDGWPYDQFGYSVALSDNTALIGSREDDDNGESSGSAYLFDTTTGSFLQKFIAPDGWPYDQFGYSVALSDNTALIGSREDDDNGESSGSAYLFDTTTGSFLQKFIAPDGSEVDNFGISVALSHNTAVIGAWGDDDKGFNSGSAYLFTTNTNTNTKSTPEPSSLLGILGTVAIAALSRKKQQKK
ncbi:WD40 repeat domain-containing protein [Dapis sp. BLCC M172]|uniref:WD40 repeat domain-containing protein n=1 Tax=Dapis sp. BLCC M172 TaxID=2975281 RepID=UPI003CF24FC1